MQFAKDSFYVALRDRLAAINPSRTVYLDGALRPAVVVAENEQITAGGPLPNVFYLAWGGARAVAAWEQARRPMLALDCTVSYWTAGTPDQQGVDRGRLKAALDSEFLRMCSPRWVRKRDYTQSPPTDLGSAIYWTRPQLGPAAGGLQPAQAPQWQLSPDQVLTASPDPTLPPVRLPCRATVTLYFFSEDDLA
jgi:hypothetical protein